jgi:hypothetical protein
VMVHHWAGISWLNFKVRLIWLLDHKLEGTVILGSTHTVSQLQFSEDFNNAATRLWEWKVSQNKEQFMYCWLVKVVTHHGIQSLHEGGGVPFDECLLLHNCCVYAGLCTGIWAMTVHC